jgi:hypothetical protein
MYGYTDEAIGFIYANNIDEAVGASINIRTREGGRYV